MKKKLLIPLFIVLGLGALLFLLNIAGFYKVSKAGGAANDPGLVVGQRFVYSKLISPERFDLICFKRDDPYFGKGQQFVFRLIGLPGDQIEFRNGNAFVNGDSVDQKLNLKHMYVMDHPSFVAKEKFIRYTEKEPGITGNDSVYLILLDSNVVNQKIPATRVHHRDMPVHDSLFGSHDGTWFVDDFGPVTVPEKSFFVLGDNRDFSSDSRYIGFINADSFIGTVFWKL